jgi:hypothetical protein
VDSQQPLETKKNRPDVPTGAVGGICIYDFMLGLNWKGDPSVRDGMAWLSERFAVTGNPQEEKGKVSPEWHYYWLYAVERVGMLYGSAQIGRHDWSGTGARYLVEKQQADGSWGEGKYHGSPAPVLDTCCAILFLRRVTRPLQDVATVDAR